MKFNHVYSRETFENLLISKLFLDKYKRDYKSINIDRKTIFFDEKNCFILGKINLDRDIFVIEIKQKSKKDPRITLTKDAFKIMEDIGANYALVIFCSDDSKSYRLSLLTRKKVWGISEESDPKRYSFLLGEWEKTRTPEKQLSKQITNIKELLDVFDVEVVRKEFFNHYIDLYIRLYREIIKDTDFIKNLKSQQLDLVTFTKNLLGKIVFLYFIQKKWWLWVEKDKNYWDSWDKNFMRSLRIDFIKNDKKTIWEQTGYFYNDYLEHLFYEWLNKDNRDNNDLNDYFNFKVPYLNGWLFKKDYENWNINRAKISNDIFSNKDETGILDIFDTYNFTIDEDDLYDKEIAVDPEMLGKIFEKMISISSENIDSILEEYNKNESSGKKKKLEIDNILNKKLGAFYTPREIVHYMTKESLIAYLVNNLKWKKEDNEEKIRQLFDFKEQFLLNEQILHKEQKEIFIKLSNSIYEVDEILKKVKVLDPAIWSGAFPMWLLHEISTLRYYIYEVFYKHYALSLELAKNISWMRNIKIQWFPENLREIIDSYSISWKISMYLIKRNVIQNNIYWVDISSWAIDIARLRFWLALVVDEENPEPLPNFEFKFVCANTLIPLEEDKSQKQLEFDWVKEINLETLKKYMNTYYNAQTNKDKEEWKVRIEKFLWIWKNIVMDLYATKSARTKQLETYEPFNPNHSAEFFDSSLMMWNSKFDIVIGNPPYISNYWRQAKKDVFTKYKKLLPSYKTFQWLKSSKTISLNTIMFFIDKWVNLCKKDWFLSYIVDQAYLNIDVYKYTRKFLFEETNLKEIITDVKFPWVIAETSILLLQNNNENNGFNWKKWWICAEKDFKKLEEVLNKRDYTISLSKMNKILSNINKFPILSLHKWIEIFTWMQIIPEFFLSNDDDKIKLPKWHKAVFSNNIERFCIKYPLKEQSKKWLYITYDTELQEKIKSELKERLSKWEKCRTPESLSIWSKEKENRFFPPKIIISQTVSNSNWIIKLQSALDDEIWYYWNVSIHIIL